MNITRLISPVRHRGTAVLAACSILLSSAFGASFFDAGGAGGVNFNTARGGTQTLNAVPNWNWAAISNTTSGFVNNTGDLSYAVLGDVASQGNVTITYGKFSRGGANLGKLMLQTTATASASGRAGLDYWLSYAAGTYTPYRSTTYNTVLNTVWSNAVSASTAASAKTNSPFGTNSLKIKTGATTVTSSPANSTAYSTATINSSNLAVQLQNSAAVQLGVGAPANTTYVIRLNDLILSGASAILTLAGNSTTNYIFNIKNTLTLSSGASVQLTGGIQAQNVLFNVESNKTVGLSGGSTLNGIILAKNSAVGLSGASTVVGQVIAKSISLTGSSKIRNPLLSP